MARRIPSVVYTFLFLYLGLCLPLSAQLNPGRVQGHVVSAAGNPAEYAVVVLQGTDYHATTDASGNFTLSAPAGRYTLLVNLVGFRTLTRELALRAGAITRLGDLTLEATAALDEVSVLGKTETQQLKEQPFAVTAIDLKSFQSLNRDINQVLNTTTGVRIREEGGLGSNFNFSLNGFSGNQVKFFLDGIPIDNFGSSLTLNNFPANAAERIEVYKGVLPIHLGADALGGAVNIVTRQNANYLDASYSIGSFNTHRVALNGAYTNARTGFTVRANTFLNYSDNNYRVLAPIKDLTTSSFVGEQWVRRFHDTYQSGTAQVEAGVTGKTYADQLLLGVIASGNDKDVQTGVVMERVFGALTNRSRTLVPTLKYKKADLLPGLNLSAYAAYNMTRFTLVDTTAREYNWLGQSKPNASSSNNSVGGENSRSRNQNRDREALLTANLTYRLTDHQTLGLNYLGTRFRRTSFDPENPEALGNRFPSELGKNSLGLAWNFELADKFSASVFGKYFLMQSMGYQQVDAFTAQERYESTTFRYDNPGYGAAAAYFIRPTLQAKASYEHAYRLPEGNEIFGDGVFVVYAVGLRPERSDNVNLGLRYATPAIQDHRLTAETNLLSRLTQDFIRLDQSVSGGNRRYLNQGRVRTLGAEAELTYSYKKRLFASINGTYQHITDQQELVPASGFTGSVTRNVTYGFRLPNLPYLFGNATAGVNLPARAHHAFSLLYTLNYVDQYYLVYAELGESSFNQRYIIPTQVAHNLAASYSLADGKYSLALECRNLTDNLLYDSYRLQKPGRSFSAKLRYFISK